MSTDISIERGARDSFNSQSTSPPLSPFELSWSKATTPLEAIERALYAMANQVSGVTSEEAETWTVSVHARSATADPDKLAHLMRQEVTDQSLRMRIAERTDPIRNLIFAVAFSRTDLQSADNTAVARPEQP